MLKTRIPLSKPDIGELEHANVNESLENGWITQGPFVEQAEERLKAITGRRYAICTASGTTSLIVALLACRDKVGWREVAVPALTFAAVHNAVKLVGMIPRYLSANLSTWQIHEESYGPIRGIRAIITAPCYGKVESSAIREWGLVSPDTFVIEDAAESFGGSLLDGRPAGSFGDVSCISFYANKICTAAEGGALLTDDSDLATRMRTIINHGIDNKQYRSVTIGLNGRMTDLQAAVLCAQLRRMEMMLLQRRYIALRYSDAAGSEWSFPQIVAGEVCAPWLFAGIPDNKEEVAMRCNDANIEWRPFFHIPDEAPDFAEMRNTRWLSRSGICLPLYSSMTEEEIDRVCEVIRG